MPLPPPQPPPEPPAKESFAPPLRYLHCLAWAASALFLIALAAPFLGMAALFAPGPLTQQKTVIVAHGTTAADIAAQLEKQNAVYLAPLFHVAARLLANDSLKAGEYALPARASPADIATMMHEGRSVVRLFTAAEGLTSSEIAQLLNDDPALTGTIAATPAEGSLLPETYRYSYGDSRAGIITRMQKAMREKINEIWASRESGLPIKSPQEAVVLASIVEKETSKPTERARIAGVFYNRLRLNMRLQSDPTVIYAITQGKQTLDRPLTHDDLAVASPLNTYASDGIPPQPICNPGRASLQAVTHPEHNDFLYFVADGTGGHAFAPDLATQNANINRWHQAQKKAETHQ
ncbi:MAG: endolytic transglycosylase MltG [Alphaproteobacteria bacterium]|nr:endolytic transglycosylase MltG [Alphaproteobacteria bacterium]